VLTDAPSASQRMTILAGACRARNACFTKGQSPRRQSPRRRDNLWMVGYTEVIQDGAHADQYPGSRPVFRNSDRASTPGYRDPGVYQDFSNSQLTTFRSGPPRCDVPQKPLRARSSHNRYQFGTRVRYARASDISRLVICFYQNETHSFSKNWSGGIVVRSGSVFGRCYMAKVHSHDSGNIPMPMRTGASQKTSQLTTMVPFTRCRSDSMEKFRRQKRYVP
jgi:hypothetical protein